jgi:ribosome biogenesis GTPase
MTSCKFNNCLHVNEPKCAVKDAVESGDISEERYNSYLGILAGEEMDWKEWEIR